MKKIKEYRINEGLDGVIVAKSLKHAVKQLIATKYYDCYTVKEVMDHYKDWERNGYDAKLTDWSADVRKHCKKGIFKKSKVLGWCEY